MDYVGLRRRFLAAGLDNFIWVAFLFWFYGPIVGAVYDASPGAAVALLFAYASLWFNYFAFCEWRWGQTIGKNATGIEVRSCEGAPRRDASDLGDGELSFGQASVRNLLRLVDFFLVGEVMIAASRAQQRLGDKAAKTVVVRRAPRTAAPAAIRGAAEEPAAPPAPLPAERPAPKELTLKRALELQGLHLGADRRAAAGGDRPAAAGPPLRPGPRRSRQGERRRASSPRRPCSTVSWSRSRSAWPPGGASAEGGPPACWGCGASPLGDRLDVRRARRLLPRGDRRSRRSWCSPNQEDIGKQLGVCNPGIGIAIWPRWRRSWCSPRFAEEIFFRGFFFAGLRSRWSLWPSALLSGAVFGLVHAPTGPTAAIPLAGLGVGLAWLYNKTGSIWPCMLAHCLNNALAISVVVAQC